LREEDDAGLGSLVSVPFHGRTVRGWVVGPATEPPSGRLLPVRKIRSAVRFFDAGMLDLLRWVSERYVAPLATAIERSHPPRVVGEESAPVEPPAANRSAPLPASAALAVYGGERLLDPGTTTWLRPLPRDEVTACVAGVAACLGSGRRALILVPEAEPLPATAAAVLEAFGPRATGFLGGNPRERYRAWLDIRSGRFDVVVGTRPAVFAPLADLGLIWISREVHPGHREDRAPYYHVREVAMARAGIEGAACVLASLSPSVETVAAAGAGAVRVARAPRGAERDAAPLVESVPPEAEDRSARLGHLLKTARSGVLLVSRTGYGVARVCRSCSEPAACATCHGPIVAERGRSFCRACGATGTCANCGGHEFGLERGGTERVAEWAKRQAGVRVELQDEATAPSDGRILVGTAAAVKDFGPRSVDLVAILDPDRALRRAGIHAGAQALATWMEAAAWAGPRTGVPRPGRVLVQTNRPGHPAIQSLVRWDPVPFLRSEAARRTEAGFAPNHPVFRIEGSAELPAALRSARPETLLATGAESGTVCLVAVRPEALDVFRQAVLRLVSAGVVERVEAEPQL
jgi:primosomal protein N' (replication factor Y)